VGKAVNRKPTKKVLLQYVCYFWSRELVIRMAGMAGRYRSDYLFSGIKAVVTGFMAR